jgi:hypothetical protein
MDGVAAIPHLREASPDSAVLVFTAYDTDERVLGAISRGEGLSAEGRGRGRHRRGGADRRGGGSALEPRVAASSSPR